MIIQIPHSKETEGLQKGQEVCVRVSGVLIGYGRILEVSASSGLKVQLSKQAEENIPNLYQDIPGIPEEERAKISEELHREILEELEKIDRMTGEELDRYINAVEERLAKYRE